MVCLVKALVFPVVMYGCESWTVKKAEHRRTDAFELWSPPGDLPNLGIKPSSLVSPALADGFFTTKPPGKLQGC